MLTFSDYLNESNNNRSHMEHIEDSVLNGGVKGTRSAIDYIRALRDALGGKTTKKITASLKLDGAPSVIAGIDPNNGKFFVAKKGVFNKNPKVYYTPADIDADTSGDLNVKLKLALQHFPKLGIKNIIQGDFMFAKSDIKTQTIDDADYVTFHPNTIVYAVPKNSDIAKQILRAEVGVVWHTSYTGNSFESLKANFNVDILSGLKKTASVWATHAVIKDLSGTTTMTADETSYITEKLSELGKIFKSTPASTFNDITNSEELLIRIKTFNNTKVRAGEKINDHVRHVSELINYINTYYQKEEDSRKTEAGKGKIREKKEEIMKYFKVHSADRIANVFRIMNLIVDCKDIIISKLNAMQRLNTFLLTKDGFRVTGQEGFVVADHIGKNALKIVDRLEFSRANFGGAIRGWEKK